MSDLGTSKYYEKTSLVKIERIDEYQPIPIESFLYLLNFHSGMQKKKKKFTLELFDPE